MTTRTTAADTEQAAMTTSSLIFFTGVDNDGIVFLNEERGKFAEHIFRKVVSILKRIGRTDEIETQADRA